MKIKTAMPNLLVDGSIFKSFTILNETGITLTATQLGLRYYHHSGNKTCSSMVEDFTEDGVLTASGETTIGQLINAYYGDDWKRQYDALMSEYNPIENYDRMEDGDHRNTYGNKSHTTGAQTVTEGSHQDSNEHLSSAFDATTYAPESKDVLNVAQKQNTFGQRIDSDASYVDTLHNESRIHGNIGVTTTQQMIQSELELRLHNFFDIIIRDVDKLLTLKIYT